LIFSNIKIYFKNIVLSDNERKALLELTALKIQGNIKYENIVKSCKNFIDVTGSEAI
jgi:hypothetical protein